MMIWQQQKAQEQQSARGGIADLACPVSGTVESRRWPGWPSGARLIASTVVTALHSPQANASKAAQRRARQGDGSGSRNTGQAADAAADAAAAAAAAAPCNHVRGLATAAVAEMFKVESNGMRAQQQKCSK